MTKYYIENPKGEWMKNGEYPPYNSGWTNDPLKALSFDGESEMRWLSVHKENTDIQFSMRGPKEAIDICMHMIREMDGKYVVAEHEFVDEMDTIYDRKTGNRYIKGTGVRVWKEKIGPNRLTWVHNPLFDE